MKENKLNAPLLENKIKTSFFIDRSLLKKFKQKCIEQEKSMVEIISKLLREYVE